MWQCCMSWGLYSRVYPAVLKTEKAGDSDFALVDYWGFYPLAEHQVGPQEPSGGDITGDVMISLVIW